jgi:hypothetical protein
VKVQTLTTKNFVITSQRRYTGCKKGARSEIKRKKR